MHSLKQNLRHKHIDAPLLRHTVAYDQTLLLKSPRRLKAPAAQTKQQQQQQEGHISFVDDESAHTLTSDVKVAAAKKRPSSEMAAM